jgi:hypothetical protein
MDTGGSMQKHRPQGEEFSYREADFASSLGIPGASRRGWK